MNEATMGDSCPYCRTSLSRNSTAVDGRFEHRGKAGFHVDGERVKALPAVHRLLGAVMRMKGRPLGDERIAEAIRCRDGDIRKHVAVVTSNARRMFREAGIEIPFERVRAEGVAWRNHGMDVRISTNRTSICGECGYDLVPQTRVEVGPFAHDPVTGKASLDGINLVMSPQLHTLLGSFMRSRDQVLAYDVIADRIGSTTDDPARTVNALVCRLKSVVRGRNATLPIRSSHGVGYVWDDAMETDHKPRQGPPTPERMRLGVMSGPDLSIGLDPPCGGLHACGCPLDTPTIWSDGWSWNDRTGLRLVGTDIVIRGDSAHITARVMAASGGYVHAVRDLHDVIGGTESQALRHLGILVHKVRSACSDRGVEIPLCTGYGQGIRWAGSAPVLSSPDPTGKCFDCLERTTRPEGRDEDLIVRSHPSSLRNSALLMAEVLSASPGEILPYDRIMRLIGSTGKGGVLKVHLNTIRNAYHAEGLDNPVRSRWGIGLEWLVIPDERLDDRVVRREEPGTPRKKTDG